MISLIFFNSWFSLFDDDNDDNDHDDDKLYLRNDWQTKSVYALFPAVTIVRDSLHRKSPTRCKQGLNLRRICVKTLLNKVV